MPRRLLTAMVRTLSYPQRLPAPAYVFSAEDVVWAMGSFCALNRKPFDAELLIKQFPPPYNADSLIHAARALGFKIKRKECDAQSIAGLHLPCLIVMRAETTDEHEQHRPTIVVQATGDQVVVFEAGQLAVMLLIIFFNSALVKSVGETFHSRHTWIQAFTVLAYALFPFFLARMLNAFSDITPWVSWIIGILLTIGVMYHGVPRVMLPDPAHAFGLYMSASLLMLLSTGLLELVIAFFLSGKLEKLDRVISAIAARLPF